MPLSRSTPQESDELYYDELDEDVYDDEPQPSRRNFWLRRLFWVGTALAPIAAVLLVMGQGLNPLRAAAALAILGVVCIGLSVTLRDSCSETHAELAEDLHREIDEVRSELETLRRGVQLTVNRELGQVRGELEAAQQVLRTEATRLPASNGKFKSSPPGVAPVSAQASVRPLTSPRKSLRERRSAAVGESTSAVPIAQQTSRARPRDNGYSEIERRSVVGTRSSYDPLSSTASHPIVTQAAAHRRLSDPYTVEPIREKYSSPPVPSQRNSFVDRPAAAYADSNRSRSNRPVADPSVADVLYGDVLSSREVNGSEEKWSWANSTSTQDWQPDFDLPSLDGLPMPGYAPGSAPDQHLNGGSGKGRHSVVDNGDAPWYRG